MNRHKNKFHTKIRDKKDRIMHNKKDNAVEVLCSLFAVGGFLTVGLKTGFVTAYILAGIFFVIAIAWTVAEMRGK